MEDNQIIQEPVVEDTTPEFTEPIIEGEVDNQINESSVTTEPEPFLNIKFNKEERFLTEEEARNYAQKGMKFDDISQELTQLKESNTNFSKSHSLIERYAQKNGMTVDQYIDYVNSVEEQERIKEMAAQHGITDDDFAKEFYEMKQKLNNYESQSKQAQETKQQEQAKRESFIRLAEYYQQEYGRVIEPEKDVPQEVFAIAEAKQVPVDIAFQLYEVQQLKLSQKIANKNNENSNASVGSVTSMSVNENSEYTQEMIDNMTVQEMAKHIDKPKFKKAIGIN